MPPSSTSPLEELSNCDIQSLREKFQSRRTDLRFLELLNSELKKRNTDESNEFQIEVITAKKALSPPSRSTPAAIKASSTGAPSPQNWVTSFLAARGLSRPTGRALHRYRMSETEYDDLKARLKSIADQGRLTVASDFISALFVPYCAEWFRRESSRTFLKWEDPLNALGVQIPYLLRQELTKRGLHLWSRQLRRSRSGREFLLTLALEGGFPVRILVDGTEGGWLRDYLRSIMRGGMSVAKSEEDILDIAQAERERVRTSYQHEDFVALCAELAWRLLELRREVESASGGAIRNSALLDLHHPGWRDELPVHVPPEDEALATELISGLLDERLTGLTVEGVEAKRFLLKRGEAWRPAVQFLADGEVAPSRLPPMNTKGRMRAVPNGELANRMSGEAALFEPPLDKAQRYRVRPLTRTAKLIPDFPFLSPVTVTLHAPDCAPAAWTWPRGEALRSDVLVFAKDTAAANGETLLRYIRSGSVKSPEKELFVLIPEKWHVEGSSAEAVESVEVLPALTRKLVHITAMAYFSASGKANDSERYRVEPNASDQHAELLLPSASDPGFALVSDRLELLTSPASISIREAGQSARQPRPRELWLRPAGGTWSQVTGPIQASGIVELSWRDPLAGIQIQKRRLALLPAGAKIIAKMEKPGSGVISMNGLPGWSAALHEGQCDWRMDSAGRIIFTFDRRPTFRLHMNLHPPAGPPVEVVLPVTSRYPVIVLSNGATPDSQIDVGELRGAVAMSPKRATLQITAPGNKASCITQTVDRELPLGILRSAIDEVLATTLHQDDVVKLFFLGDSRPPIRISRYRQPHLMLTEDRLELPSPGAHTVMPVARMILNPKREYALHREDASQWRIPESCGGPCLVYLRDGPDVVSRPTPVARPNPPAQYSGCLVAAVSVSDFNLRQIAIKSALSDFASGETGDGSSIWLLDLIANLNGLPASALDALKMLPSYPVALVRLLLGARDGGERAAVWSLQNGLPFLWLALPLRSWREAITKEFTSLARALEPVFGPSKANDEALRALLRISDELLLLDASLAGPLRAAGVPMNQSSVPTLAQLVNAHITSQPQQDTELRNDIGEQLANAGISIHHDISSKSHQDFAGLFAPLLLAASAREKLSMTTEQALLVRRTLREDPAYVANAFLHLLSYYEPK